MKKNILSIVLLLFLGSLLGGCAMGNKYKIADVEAKINATGNGSVAVASIDKRKFVVDKTSPETYVGMVRGGYGNPFDATTESNLPFAVAVTRAICKSLDARGFHSMPVTVKVGTTEQEAQNLLLKNNLDKNILVVISEWESDSFYNLNIGYDFLLTVLDKDGTPLATSAAKDKVAVSGSVMTGSLSLSKTKVPATFQKAIETLLNDPNVVQALSGD